MTNKFYAADNSYGSETDIGFSNTWYVVSFDTKELRDAFVNKSNRCSTRSIKSVDVKRFGGVQLHLTSTGDFEVPEDPNSLMSPEQSPEEIVQGFLSRNDALKHPMNVALRAKREKAGIHNGAA